MMTIMPPTHSRRPKLGLPSLSSVIHPSDLAPAPPWPWKTFIAAGNFSMAVTNGGFYSAEKRF